MIGRAHDVATTEVKVQRKMCAVLCKENTEPLTKRMEHVSLHIIHYPKVRYLIHNIYWYVYGMRERFVQEKEFTICTQPF